ncbi:MAG: hypothetical protein ACOX4F_01660 [Atopobiaceae bacterium]|jgi:hypothetical protein
MGESLVETLVALLVCTLATALLLMGVSVATELNHRAQTRAEELQVQCNAAEAEDAYLGSGGNTASVTVGSSTYEVELFGGDDLVSYRRGGNK